MKEPQLKWVETSEPNEMETLLLNIGGQISQPCSRCKGVMDGGEDNWGMTLKANMIGTTVFEVEFFCPRCLEGYLVNRNRVQECRLDGAKDPSKCADYKAEQEGEYQERGKS